MPDGGKVGILISGRGSNMLALLDAMDRGEIPGFCAVVLSNVPDAPGLAVAADRGVPTEVVDSKKIKPRRAHEEQVVDLLKRYDLDLVCLAGYMRLLSPLMVSAFRGRMLNIHPSLLPAFPGLHAQRQALEHLRKNRVFYSTIKLWADMGETELALKYADRRANRASPPIWVVA